MQWKYISSHDEIRAQDASAFGYGCTDDGDFLNVV